MLLITGSLCALCCLLLKVLNPPLSHTFLKVPFSAVLQNLNGSLRMRKFIKVSEFAIDYDLLIKVLDSVSFKLRIVLLRYPQSTCR